MEFFTFGLDGINSMEWWNYSIGWYFCHFAPSCRSEPRAIYFVIFEYENFLGPQWPFSQVFFNGQLPKKFFKIFEILKNQIFGLFWQFRPFKKVNIWVQKSELFSKRHFEPPPPPSLGSHEPWHLEKFRSQIWNWGDMQLKKLRRGILLRKIKTPDP